MKERSFGWGVAVVLLGLVFLTARCGGAPEGSETKNGDHTFEQEARKKKDAGPPDAGAADAGAPDAGRPFTLSLNDVSILMPLPDNTASKPNHLWLIPSAGLTGPYFPADATLPALNGDVPKPLGYPSAMVVAFRYDPCFPSVSATTCQAQIRLGAQPVLFGADGQRRMLNDSAVHLFYALTPAQSKAVARALLDLKALSPVSTDVPVGIHPALLAQGMNGPVATTLKALILANCRHDNLVRITTNGFVMDNWIFAKFEKVDGKWAAQPLGGLVTFSMNQAWIRKAFVESTEDSSGVMAPRPAESFEYFLDRANFAGGQFVPSAATRQAADVLLQVENPKLRDAETTDCVSCHVATQARLFAERKGVSFGSNPNAYVAPAEMNVTLLLPPSLQGNLGATVSFGYHRDNRGEVTPSISQRVINESAEVARYANTKLLP